MGCGEWVGGTSLCLTPTSGARDRRRIGVGGTVKAASSLVRKGVVGERRPDPENQGGLLFSFMTIPTLAQALASRRFSASICHINEQTSGFSLTRSWLNFEAEGKEGCQFGGPPKPHPPPLTSKNQSLPLSKGVLSELLDTILTLSPSSCVTRKKPQFSTPVKWAEMSTAPESVLCKVASVMSDL